MSNLTTNKMIGLIFSHDKDEDIFSEINEFLSSLSTGRKRALRVRLSDFYGFYCDSKCKELAEFFRKNHEEYGCVETSLVTQKITNNGYALLTGNCEGSYYFLRFMDDRLQLQAWSLDNGCIYDLQRDTVEELFDEIGGYNISLVNDNEHEQIENHLIDVQPFYSARI